MTCPCFITTVFWLSPTEDNSLAAYGVEAEWINDFHHARAFGQWELDRLEHLDHAALDVSIFKRARLDAGLRDAAA